MDLQTKPKLILILDGLDLSQVAKTLESDSAKGPTGYNPEAILRALLAQQIESIPTRASPGTAESQILFLNIVVVSL